MTRRSVVTKTRAIADVNCVLLVWERNVEGGATNHTKIPVNKTLDLQPDVVNRFVLATHDGQDIVSTMVLDIVKGTCTVTGELVGSPDTEVCIIGMFKANITNTNRRAAGLRLPTTAKQLAPLIKPPRKPDWKPKKYGR